MKENRIDEALQALEDRRHPWASVVWKSGLLGQFGEHEKALELLLRTTEQYPGRYELEYDLASHLRSLGRLPEALPHAERAFRALPGRGARLLLAKCYLGSAGEASGQDRIEKARGLLETFAKSRWPTALSALAQARADSMRGGAKASDAWRRILEIGEVSENNRAVVLTHLSRSLFHEGDRVGAAEEAEAAFDAGKDTLDPQTLGFCGQMMLYASPKLSDHYVRRVKEVARTLRCRFPGDQIAEEAYLLLYLNLGTPADMEPADYSGLINAGSLRSMSIDKASEIIRQAREQGSAAWRLYRLGRLTAERFSKLTGTPLARLIASLLRTRPTEQQFLAAPVDPMIDLPALNLDGKKLLLGELELLILKNLGVLDRVRRHLGSQGKLLIFRDVLTRMAENATELSLAAPEERLGRRRGLLDTLLNHRNKVRFEGNRGHSSELDSTPILEDLRPEEPRLWLPTSSVLRWLMKQGSVDQTHAERHLAALPPGEPIYELPPRLMATWSALIRLLDLEALETVIDEVDELIIAENDHRFMLSEIQEAEIQVEAAQRSRELYDWLNQGRVAGWVEVAERPEVIRDLPPLHNSEESPLFKEIIAEPISWYQALEENPEALLITGDYLVSAVFSGGMPLEIFSTLAWTPESYRAMSVRVRTLAVRRTGLSHFVRHLLMPGEEDKLLTLTRLGYVLALDADMLLRHIRRYAKPDREDEAREPAKKLYSIDQNKKATLEEGAQEGYLGKRVEELLTRAEWTARQRSHAGSVLAGLVVTRLYANTIWRCWVKEERWSDAQRANITQALLARVEEIEGAGAPGLLEHLLRLLSATAVDNFTAAFIPDDGGVTSVLSDETAPARLWTVLTDWSRGHRRRRAELDRALLDVLRALDELLERGPSAEPRLAVMMLAILARQQEPHHHIDPVVLAIQALSASWQIKPLEHLAIGFRDEDGNSTTLTFEQLPVQAARHLEDKVAGGVEVEDAHWRVVVRLGPSSAVAVEVSPEAVILRTSSDKVEQSARVYQEAVGIHDGRLFQILERLLAAPEDPHVRHELARAAALAPYRLVRQDPLWITQWGQIGYATTGGYPRSLGDLRQILSQPAPSVFGNQGLKMPAMLDDVLLGDGGPWWERPDVRALASMASEVPGLLSAVMARSRVLAGENEYNAQVRAAIRRLQRPADQPIAQLEGDMVFLRVAAALRPQVELERGFVDLREMLPELFTGVVREEMPPVPRVEGQETNEADQKYGEERTCDSISLRTAEPALLRLCMGVVVNLARSEPTAHESELLWLTWRLFQWLELQLRTLPLTIREASLKDLSALSPPPVPSEQAMEDILDPRRFDPREMPHRLIGDTCALSRRACLLDPER
jgi:tetratricopeptide (TPR) repeat protein